MRVSLEDLNELGGGGSSFITGVVRLELNERWDDPELI
jgi:hypothetical protein